MKTLRSAILALMVAAVSFSATQAFAQQEVDPDHFDQPVAAKPAAPSHKASVQHHANTRASVASKHSKQRHTHVAA
jgi:hypothetical protein